MLLPLLLSLLLCTACRAPVELPGPSVQQYAAEGGVTVMDVRFPVPAIGSLLWYRAVLPSAAPGERLPVLYLLHGAQSNPAELEQRAAVIKLAAAERLIVIMPEGRNSYYTNARLRRRARWEDAMTQDLLRDVESRFAVLPGREHRGIAGLSMGGYGAVKLALKHPELYGFAGSMSGAFDVTRRPASLKRWEQTLRLWRIFGARQSRRENEDIFALLARTQGLQSVAWFQSCGMRDPLYPVNARFTREMHARSVPFDAVTTPGFHDWLTWETTMPQLFKSAGESLR